jgi:hypothetical protein
LPGGGHGHLQEKGGFREEHMEGVQGDTNDKSLSKAIQRGKVFKKTTFGRSTGGIADADAEAIDTRKGKRGYDSGTGNKKWKKTNSETTSTTVGPNHADRGNVPQDSSYRCDDKEV